MRRLVRIGALIAALGFLAAALAQQWQAIEGFHWALKLDLLALSLIALVVIFFLDALGWHLVLVALGHRHDALRSIRVWMISSLARYIPGGIWSYTSRALLAKAEGVSLASASISLLLETLLLMSTSFVIGLCAVLPAGRIPDIPAWSVGIFLAAAVLLHPKALSLLRFFPGIIGQTISREPLPGFWVMIFLFTYYCLFWLAFGSVFVVFVSAFYSVPLLDWAPLGGSLAFGFFWGFIFLFVPGGIGIRESAIYLLLAPFLPAPVCTVIAIASRLWIMAGEVISLLAVCLLDPKGFVSALTTKPRELE
jgi:uncharacterized membrane protein YbhN (UPF0104 family)